MTITPDTWEKLRSLTHARIALGRAGHSVPTKELLNFRLAHSQARDSVWREVDFASLKKDLEDSGLDVIEVQSQCTDKQNYLLYPDLGRKLAPQSLQILSDLHKPADCAIVIADGLSAHAVHANASNFVKAYATHLQKENITTTPIVVARYGRVAIGDEIGVALNARSVLVLIGERPGLASADSLSVYFTYKPHANCKDNDRNCISNIHMNGTTPEAAAYMAAFLTKNSIVRQLSGVDLKVEYPAIVTEIQV